MYMMYINDVLILWCVAYKS